jgi:hypothetical protein
VKRSHNLYWDDEKKDDKIVRECSEHREIRNAYKILVGKPEEKKATQKTKV